MEFKLNKIELEKVNKLIETNYYNDEIAEFINNNLIGRNYNDLEEKINLVKINELNINNYLNNSYFKLIKPKATKINNYFLHHKKYYANEIFLSDEIFIDEKDYFLISYKLGYFTKDYNYLALDYKNTTWMSIIPHEINTIKRINNTHKKIYVLGLGLGYFPFINENNYDEILIIEKDKNIIDLFKKNIFIYFKNKHKYKFINDDVFNKIELISKDDDVFVDIYHNQDDGLYFYYKLNHLLNNENIIYWIEDTILASFRHIFINLIEEEIYYKGNFNYLTSKSFVDELINKLHNYFLNYKINNYLDLEKLLSKDYLKDLIKKI